eukprot:CAMPEP_0117420356 /NCGR_PEP_ID=MMETSP0758-20121206/1702_1 /TAXON_ID=63605 /ORGANISM="Percolomonas cosmopolitus, Strain AE-1 (ATCC 50343)" /LENGTH=296 /DNA_ID=CAMNT_0005201907 /DNA_START=77 /DNA_END=964 /DNA_ORIENTATION=+
MGSGMNYGYIPSLEVKRDNFEIIDMKDMKNIEGVYCYTMRTYYNLTEGENVRKVLAHYKNIPEDNYNVQSVLYTLPRDILRIDVRELDKYDQQPEDKSNYYDPEKRVILNISCSERELLPVSNSQAAILLSIILLLLSAQKFNEDLAKILQTAKIAITVLRHKHPIRQMKRTVSDKLMRRKKNDTVNGGEQEALSTSVSSEELEKTKAVFHRCLSCGRQITPVNYKPLFFDYYACKECLSSQTMNFISALVISIGAVLISLIVMNVSIIKYIEENVGPRMAISLAGFNGIYVLVFF